tara:strand:- start:61 stop:306 length:246 start_codon:yes stop_codon:yes gene_type:complete
MRGVSIERSATIVGVGAGCVMCSWPTILLALFAIDLQVFAITLLLSAREGAFGTAPFKPCAHIATQSRVGKSGINDNNVNT